MLAFAFGLYWIRIRYIRSAWDSSSTCSWSTTFRSRSKFFTKKALTPPTLIHQIIGGSNLSLVELRKIIHATNYTHLALNQYILFFLFSHPRRKHTPSSLSPRNHRPPASWLKNSRLTVEHLQRFWQIDLAFVAICKLLKQNAKHKIRSSPRELAYGLGKG